MSKNLEFQEYFEFLVSLSNPTKYKEYAKNLAAHQFDIAKVSEDFSSIKFLVRDSVTGEYEEGICGSDEHILNITMPRILNAPSEIVKFITHESEVEQFLKMLRVAFKKVDEDSFYDNLLFYKNALIKLENTFKEIQQAISKPLKKPQNKSNSYKLERVFDLTPYKKMMEVSETHEEAMERIHNNCPEFKWNDPKHILYTHGGKLKGSRASEALEQIGQIKFGVSEAPSASYIRIILFSKK